MKATELLKPEDREEAGLLENIDLEHLPQHIAVIMDGNGRWAQSRHLPRVAGHRAGVKTARQIIETCARLKVPCLTLYAFSLENWRRPQTEVDFLMTLLREYLKLELPVIHKNNIRLVVIGRSEQLPDAVRRDIEEGMQLTAGNTGMKLVVALNYGGRAEIVDAFNAMLDHAKSNGTEPFRADEQSISDYLYTAGLPDPDLLIRTSGEMRVSNFLLWQIAYAEIYVTETLWPDFSRARLLEALIDFQKRERRYGGLGKVDKKSATADKTAAKRGPRLNPMLLRILTAVILIPVVVALIWISPPIIVAGLAAVVAILALVEFFTLGDRVGLRGFKKWTFVCTLLVFYAQYCAGHVQTRTFSGGVSLIRDAQGGSLSLEAALLIFIFGCVAIGLFTRKPLHETFPAMAISAAGIAFVAFPFSYVVRLNETDVIGRQLLLFTLVLVWAGDVLAYFVGKSLGRVPMAPALSPKKTWEGALGNIFASMIAAVFFARWMQIDVITLVMIAAAANIAGQAGDLIESAYKRGASVKDSGGLLPGHGGMLDRIDALILAAPVAWTLYEWLARPH